MSKKGANGENGQREDTITVARGEEAILLKRDGTVERSVFPGRSVVLTEKTPYLYRTAKGSQVRGPAGFGRLRDGDGGMWSCCAEFTCHLLSAGRFAARNGTRIMEGVQDEKILRNLIREIFRGCLEENILKRALHPGQEDGPESDYWKEATEKARARLLENGWELISLEPENLRRGIHEDAYRG